MTLIAREIFHALREMDRDAKPLPDGTPTGLRGYVAHRLGYYPEGRGTPWENTLTAGLAEKLENKGFVCYPQEPYPRGSRRCDLVLEGPELRRMWIEAKGCWRNLIPDEDRDCYRAYSNGSFRNHLIKTADDVDKLRKGLAIVNASHIGLLVVGFDVMNPSGLSILDHDFEGVRSRAAGWTEEHDEWPDGA